MWAADNAHAVLHGRGPGQAPVPRSTATISAPRTRRTRWSTKRRTSASSSTPAARASKAYIFLTSSSHTASRCATRRPTSRRSVQLIAAREKDHEYYVEHHGDRFYIRTNQNAPNFRLVSAPVTDPGKARWQEVIPHRLDVMLERPHHASPTTTCAPEREGGLPQLTVTDFRSGASHRIAFPEPVYTCGTGDQRRVRERRPSATPTSRS